MTKNLSLLTFLLFSLLAFSKNQMLNNPSSSNLEIKGNIFLNLTFIKTGENHENYQLEKAIDKAQSYLNSEFAPYKVKFHFDSTIELEKSTEELLKSWESYLLPHLKNELAIYVYHGRPNTNLTHTYSFLLKGTDIAIVPFYNQSEFNLYVLKNVLHMLGVDVLKFETWKKEEENQFEIFIAEELSIENRIFVNESVGFQKGKKYSKRKFFAFFSKKTDSLKSNLNLQIAYKARQNIHNNPRLKTKNTQFKFAQQFEVLRNEQAITTITQLD